MAILIMRLKLFFTPHLCIIVSLLASRQLCSSLFGDRIKPLWLQAFCVAVVGGMAFEGVSNLRSQWAIMGEYSNVPQEQLFQWVVNQTPRDAVFAGSMPTMANLKLSTGRPIVNHPHYEDSGLRERTMKVYSIFSRKPATEVYLSLKDMGVHYVVFEYGWCSKGGKSGCSMPEVWDATDPKNRNREPLCERFRMGNVVPFTLAYQNQQYKILKI